MARWCLLLAGMTMAVGSARGQEATRKDPVKVDAAQAREPELAKELNARFRSDQAVRNEFLDFAARHMLLGTVELDKLDPEITAKYSTLTEKLKAEDRKNLQWMKEIVARHGWPGKSLVGQASARNAWLLVQHADSDREFQQACLTRMAALPEGEVDPRDFAYLTDRVLVGTGRKQKYGTQAAFKDGKVVPGAIEDPESVDERRKAIGLEPLAEYLKTLEATYIRPPKQEPKPSDKMP